MFPICKSECEICDHNKQQTAFKQQNMINETS